MDKAEIENKILDLINQRTMYIHSLKQDSWQWRSILKLLDEYTQQVSRERAIEFEKFLMKTSLDITLNNQSIEYAYDTWINQT